MPGGGNLERSPRYRKKPRAPQSAHARYYYTRSLVLESNKEKSLKVSRCQSAPRVMDSHSRSASPRDTTAARPLHRPPSPPPATPPAFDNRAYTHDEDHNHNDSFSSQQNGHAKDPPNGTQTKTPEAVNLELINLTPKNGSKKKDVEVDMNATNPYDEYFVPVNEHRKYMRGEKLYVTADKRGEKGGCKRPLCWTLLALVAAAVIALIVLAATGILFTNAPTPLDQVNSSSVSSARAFGIGAHDHSGHSHDAHDHSDHDHSHDAHDHGNHNPDAHDHSVHEAQQDMSDQEQSDHDHAEPTPAAEPAPVESSEIPTIQTVVNVPVSDESSDVAIFVPRTLEGELRIDNEEFSEDLLDSESEKFRQFNDNFGNALKRALFDRDTLENGNNNIHVEVISIRPGSLHVVYRIHWVPKSSSELSDDILTAKSMKTTLENYLERYSRMISVYHVADDKISTKRVFDLCHLNKNDCEYGCVFDETALDFICTCPRAHILDETNSKKCMSILDSGADINVKEPIEDTKQKEFRVLNIGQEGTTTKQIPDEEKPKDKFDWKSSEEKSAETTTNAGAEYKYSHVFGNPNEQLLEHELTTELESAVEPEPTVQSDTNSLSKLFADNKSKPEPEPTGEPQPATATTQLEQESSAEPEPEPSAQPEPELSAQHEPELSAQPESQAELAAKPEPEPTVKLEPEPTAKPEPEPAAKPEPGAEPEPSAEPEPTPEPKPVTDHESNGKPTDKSELSTEPRTFIFHGISAEPEPTTEAEPKPEISSEITTEPKPEITTEIKSSTDPEHTAEPQSTGTPVTPKLQSMWEYKPLTDTVFDDIEMKFDVKSTPEPEVELEFKTTTTEPLETKTIQEISLMKHLNTNKTKDKITTLETPLNDSANNEAGEIIPEVFSIYERQNEQDSSNNNNKEELQDFENNSQEATTAKTVLDFLDENMKQNTRNLTLNNNRSILPEITTAAIENVNATKANDDEDISFDLITKHNENREISQIQNQSHQLIAVEKDEEEYTTLSSTEPLLNIMPDEEKHTYNIIRTNFPSLNNNISTENHLDIDLKNVNKSDAVDVKMNTTSDLKIYPEMKSVFDRTLDKVIEETTEKISSTMVSINENVTELLQTSRSPEAMTTTKSTTTTEYSLSQNSENYQPNKMIGIMEYLENQTKTTKPTTTSTEKATTEIAEITFDAINTLFNRSSKAIGEETSIKNDTVETTTESKVTTTPSDWLSENVYEVNYKDMLLDTKKEITTTDQPLTKIEEIINKAYTKNDFEPEYMNMNPTRGPDHEESFYGMVHNDYDTEDYRVKRVNSVREGPTINNTSGEERPGVVSNNTRVKTHLTMVSNTRSGETTVQRNIAENVTMINLKKPNTITEINTQNSQQESSNNSQSQIKDEQIESTTISQYIYTTNKVRDEPAPVWEKEDESVSAQQVTSTGLTHFDDISKTETGVNTTERDNKETTTDNPTKKDNKNENTTQINNLNVTIYEIPGTNQSFTTSKSSSHSSEYVDHETEMNPFLPEVENNKSLVKKLQEGHDLIDPVFGNETQSENQDEHSVHSSVSLTSNATTDDSQDENFKPNEDESIFNDLNNENYNSPESDSTVSERNSKSEKAQEKGGPVNTFLQDTDDLDIKRVPTSTTNEMSDTVELQTVAPTAVPNAPDEDSEYLSVVPITEDRRDEKEALRKTYVNGGIQKFNDISDSPKKSDRRTFDVSKVDPVINNEA